MSRLGARYAAEYGAYLAVSSLIRAVPHTAARTLGRWMGELAHLLDRRHRAVALANVAAAFPDQPPAECRRLVRACFRHFGATMSDNLSVVRFDAAALCHRLSISGWEHLTRAEAAGRGVFLLTAHIGNFEMLAHPVALYRGPAHIIARPADNPRLDRALRRLRERFGNVTIPRRGAGRATMRVLARGGRVFILSDQRVQPKEGIELPFLGRPAVTSTLAARLSLRCGSPAVPMFCYPAPGGRFTIEVQPPIYPEGSGREAVTSLTSRYVEVTEAEIRRRPEMWLWMHDRWRQRPQPGAAGGR